MKKSFFSLTAAASVALAGVASATVYTDSTTDLHDGTGGGTDYTGFQHLNIAQVEVTNDASNITFEVTLNGDISTATGADWGKYLVGIDSGAGGDTAGNGWGRPITQSGGIDYWIGSWVDSGGGAEVYSWDGAAWNLDKASYNAPPNDTPGPALATLSTTITVALADLGLSLGDTFDFDVYSTAGGGTDGAVDALGSSTPSITDWGNAYESGSNVLSYTVIPEPASLALVALGGLAMLGRRRSA